MTIAWKGDDYYIPVMRAMEPTVAPAMPTACAPRLNPIK